MHGKAAWGVLRDTHSGNWHGHVKKALVQMIQNGNAVDLITASPETICETFHYHGLEGKMTCGEPQLTLQSPQSTEETSNLVAEVPAFQWQHGHSSYKDVDINNDDEQDANALQITVPPFP